MQLVARVGEILKQLHLAVKVDEERLVRLSLTRLRRRRGLGSAGSIRSTNFPAALRSASMAPETLRLVSTSSPTRKGRLLSAKSS